MSTSARVLRIVNAGSGPASSKMIRSQRSSSAGHRRRVTKAQDAIAVDAIPENCDKIPRISYLLYPDSLKSREKFLAVSDWTDSVARMIQSGFLSEEDRMALTALARDGSTVDFKLSWRAALAASRPACSRRTRMCESTKAASYNRCPISQRTTMRTSPGRNPKSNSFSAAAVCACIPQVVIGVRVRNEETALA